MSSTPILDNKHPDSPSVFEPAALLREARRQKALSVADIPSQSVFSIRMGTSFDVSKAPARQNSRRFGHVITPSFLN